MMTKQHWWMLDGSASRTWVGLHAGGQIYVWDTQGGRRDGVKRGERRWEDEREGVKPSHGLLKIEENVAKMLIEY